MNIIPLSKEEARDMIAPLKAGIYPFQVTTAEEKESKAGNPMLVVKITVFSPTGKEWFVFDWLLASGSMAWKLRHFMESVGMVDTYNSGNINPEGLIGKSGIAKIGNKLDDQGVLRLKVDDYLEQGSQAAKASAPARKADDQPGNAAPPIDEPPF